MSFLRTLRIFFSLRNACVLMLIMTCCYGSQIKELSTCSIMASRPCMLISISKSCNIKKWSKNILCEVYYSEKDCWVNNYFLLLLDTDEVMSLLVFRFRLPTAAVAMTSDEGVGLEVEAPPTGKRLLYTVREIKEVPRFPQYWLRVPTFPNTLLAEGSHISQ